MVGSKLSNYDFSLSNGTPFLISIVNFQIVSSSSEFGLVKVIVKLSSPGKFADVTSSLQLGNTKWLKNSETEDEKKDGFLSSMYYGF